MTNSSCVAVGKLSTTPIRNLELEVDLMEQSNLLAAVQTETGPRFSTAVHSLCSKLLRQSDVPLDAVMDRVHDLEDGIPTLSIDSSTRPYVDLSVSFLGWLQATYVNSTLRGAPSREELVRVWDGYQEIQANVIQNLTRKITYVPPRHEVLL